MHFYNFSNDLLRGKVIAKYTKNLFSFFLLIDYILLIIILHQVCFTFLLYVIIIIITIM